jgi:hypothetical protein
MGFPSKDNEPSKYDVRKRIMIRKISESTYEIFYHLIGCGADIKYLKITISNGFISTNVPLEEWIIHNDC